MDEIRENNEKTTENQEKIQETQPVVIEEKIETKGLKLKKSTKDRLNMLQSSFDDAESMITTLLNQYDSFIVENDEKYNERQDHRLGNVAFWPVPALVFHSQLGGDEQRCPQSYQS